MPGMTAEQMQRQMSYILMNSHGEGERRNFTKQVKDYLEQGGDPSLKVQGPIGDNSYEYKIGLPHILVEENAPNTMKTFIEKGGNVNMPDTFGRTASHYLLSGIAGGNTDHAKEKTAMMHMMVEKADLTLPDQKGLNPIEEAYAAAKNRIGGSLKPEDFLKEVKNGNSPELSQFRELHKALVEKFGEEKVNGWAKSGIEKDGKIKEEAALKEMQYNKDKSELPKSRFDNASAPFGDAAEKLAQNLSGKGVQETASSMSKPNAGGPSVRGLA